MHCTHDVRLYPGASTAGCRHLVHHRVLLHLLLLRVAHLVRLLRLLHESLQVGVVAAAVLLRLSQQRSCMDDEQLLVGHVDAGLGAGGTAGLDAGRLVGWLGLILIIDRGGELCAEMRAHQRTETERRCEHL